MFVLSLLSLKLSTCSEMPGLAAISEVSAIMQNTDTIQANIVMLRDLLFTPIIFFTTSISANRNWLFTGEIVSFSNRWDNVLILDLGVK